MTVITMGMIIVTLMTITMHVTQRTCEDNKFRYAHNFLHPKLNSNDCLQWKITWKAVEVEHQQGVYVYCYNTVVDISASKYMITAHQYIHEMFQLTLEYLKVLQNLTQLVKCVRLKTLCTSLYWKINIHNKVISAAEVESTQSSIYDDIKCTFFELREHRKVRCCFRV